MRWSEDQLQAHLKAHRNRANLSRERLKTENDARVQQAKNNCLERKLERNEAPNENFILSCEVATYPPSVNHYWVKSGKRFVLSDKAKAFHMIIKALIPPLQTEARLKLEVTFHFPNYQTRDIDNYLKATIDSLVKCGLCVDDEQFDELVVKRGEVVKGGLIKLKVMELG